MTIGRIPGTAMPPEWAASGAKLGLSVEVEFTDEACSYEMTKERLLMGDDDGRRGPSMLSVEPLNDPVFVSAKGQEVVKVLPGAYACQIQGLASGQYKLYFFLDFPEGAVRNDVQLPAERIYFLGSCWIGDEAVIDRAERRRDDILKSVHQIDQEFEEVQQTSATGFLQKAAGFRQSAVLFERRGKLQSQLEDLEQRYPLDKGVIIKGPNDVIFAKEGVIAVKRFRGTLGTKEQYHWVGTFSFNEFFEDEEEDE